MTDTYRIFKDDSIPSHQWRVHGAFRGRSAPFHITTGGFGTKRAALEQIATWQSIRSDNESTVIQDY